MSRWIISLVVCVVVFLMGAVDMAQANPVSKETATQLVQGWINSSSKPLGNEIDRVETVSTPEGRLCTMWSTSSLKATWWCQPTIRSSPLSASQPAATLMPQGPLASCWERTCARARMSWIA